jgi:hypothetical protein
LQTVSIFNGDCSQLLNKLVISTGAKRSGEICGCFCSVLTQALHAPEVRLFYPS